MRRGPFTVLLVLAMSGCDGGSGLPTLPTAPSDLTSGITIHEHWNYQGESAAVKIDIADLGDYAGPCIDEDDDLASYELWDDCISSIRVAPGWRAIIYTGKDFGGESLVITADVPNLQLVKGSCDHDGLNDCITSIRVQAPTAAAR